MSNDSKRLDVKKAQDEKFNWISRPDRKNVHRSDADVSINCITYEKKPFSGISFTFRNEVAGFFGDRIQFAIYKNRVMFRPSVEGEGIALCTVNKKSPNRYFKMKLTKDIEELKSKFIGDYELKYDSFYEVYYIEKEEN